MQWNRLVRIVLGLMTITAIVAGCAGTKEIGAPASTAPRADHKPVLFYAKGGSLYVSDPAGTPGRKLTDGPGDFQPAPSPDGRRLAFVRKVPESGPATPCTNNGGELWVLDLAADGAPASDPRRLVDPAALAALDNGGNTGGCTHIDSPRWSPPGDRIAFLNSGGKAGFLLTAAAATGVVQAPSRPLYASKEYSWAPDGKHIAWVRGRYDVSPGDVAVLNVVDGMSQPVATGTNAVSVAYADDGRSVLFANGDVTGSQFSRYGFTLPIGGIYSVEPPAAARPVFTGMGAYDDVAPVQGGDIGFTQWSPNQRTKSIQVVNPGGVPRTIADTSTAPSPAWADDSVAFIGTAEERPLLIATDRTPPNGNQNNEPQQVDVGVDAFAWSN